MLQTALEEDMDIQDMLLLLKDILSEIDEEDDSPAHDDENEEGDEEYASGTLGEEVRKYQREFHRYAEIITRELARLGYDIEPAGNDNQYVNRVKVQEPPVQQTAESEQQEKNPFERGHKWGCGCAGCSSFRVSFYSSGMSFEDMSLPETVSRKEAAVQVTAYTRKHREDPSEYPCGGKLRGMFSGGLSGGILNSTLEGLDRRPGIMRYLAV